MKKNLVLQSLINSILATVYILLIALFMSKGSDLFGQEDGIWAPFVMLLLFVLSAAVMGILVLSKPVMLYLDGQKKDSIKLLGYTIGWIFAITIITLVLKLAL